MARLQKNMDRLNVAYNKYGLEMNVKKTKFMLIIKGQIDTRTKKIKLILNNLK